MSAEKGNHVSCTSVLHVRRSRIAAMSLLNSVSRSGRVLVIYRDVIRSMIT